MEGLVFEKLTEERMSKNCHVALSTLFIYWMTNDKLESFDLPLFINDSGKGTLSVEMFKAVFYAFQCKIGKFANACIKSGDDGDTMKYNVVHIDICSNGSFDANDLLIYSDYIEPLANHLKRESSKKTAEKSKAKKAEAEAKKIASEAESDANWNKKAVAELSKYISSQFKVTSDKLATIEKDMLTILNSIK